MPEEVPPAPLAAIEEDILFVLRKTGRRLTGGEVRQRLAREKHVRDSLVHPVKLGVLDNRRDCRPRGTEAGGMAGAGTAPAVL